MNSMHACMAIEQYAISQERHWMDSINIYAAVFQLNGSLASNQLQISTNSGMSYVYIHITHCMYWTKREVPSSVEEMLLVQQ